MFDISSPPECSIEELNECQTFMYVAFARVNAAKDFDERVRITVEMLEFMYSHPRYLASNPLARTLLRQKVMSYVTLPEFADCVELFDISKKLMELLVE